MPLSKQHKALFIHIPKTGGQSISKMLGIQKGLVQNLYAEGLTHLTLPMIEQRMDIEGYYIFMFVRNPYDKVRSEYRWRMNNRSAAIFNEPTRNHMSFEQYMELLLERWPVIMNDSIDPDHKRHREICHVIPQTYYLDGRIEIYKHDDFENECRRLQEKLGLSVPIPHVNKGHNLPQHTKRTLEITRELYKEDFETFDY